MIDPFQGPEILEHSDVVVDVGVNPDGVPAADAYRSGHIPGAVFIDLDTVLAGPPSMEHGQRPLPPPGVFAKGMRQAGIRHTDLVIAHDRVGGTFAARLVWMLRAVGQSAALLDGGLAAYRGKLQQGVVTPVPSDFNRDIIPRDRLADIDEVRSFSDRAEAGQPSDTVLIDARDTERYRGDSQPDSRAVGHIPGATSLPCREHLDADGRLLPAEALLGRIASAGITSATTPVISSCGSGVTACHNLLVLEQLGFSPGRLYPGSWSQWSGRDNPIARGDRPNSEPFST